MKTRNAIALLVVAIGVIGVATGCGSSPEVTEPPASEAVESPAPSPSIAPSTPVVVSPVATPIASPTPAPRPSAAPSPTPARSPATTAAPAQTEAVMPTDGDYDCKDFSSRAEVDRVFEANPGDPFDLDRDKDGIPCESL